MLPLVTRELSVALRRGQARQRWVWSTVFTAGIVILALTLAVNFAGLGRTLFAQLFFMLCFFVVVRGLSVTADLLSEERRNGTLGLLVIAGLQPVEIFTYKLLGAVLLNSYTILGALPMLAISFLIGGVTNLQFVGALVALGNLLLFCVAAGLLASVKFDEGGRAHLTATAGVILFFLAMPAVQWFGDIFFGAGFIGDAWLVLNPIYGPYQVWRGFPAGVANFWMSSGFTLVCSLTALVLAAAILHRTWRETPLTTSRRGWQKRSARKWREQLRQQTLDTYPFCWLAARDHQPVFNAGCFLVGLAVLWLAGCIALGRSGYLVMLSIVCSLVLHQGLNWFYAYAAARPLAAERQNGGLEILLTTCVDVPDVINGQMEAITFQFKRVQRAAYVLDALFLAGALVGGSFGNYHVFVCMVSWVLWHAGATAARRIIVAMSMWIGAWTGRPVYAALQAMRPILLMMLTFTPTKSAEFILEKLWRELRLIACAPIPARGDKRFASWNPTEVFPPGRWGELALNPASPSWASLSPSRRRKRS